MTKQPSQYTIRTGKNPGAFLCIKYDPNSDTHETYYMSEEGASLYCTCKAHMNRKRKWCRHCDILRLFQAEGKVNSEEYYIHDTKTWVNKEGQKNGN